MQKQNGLILAIAMLVVTGACRGMETSSSEGTKKTAAAAQPRPHPVGTPSPSIMTVAAAFNAENQHNSEQVDPAHSIVRHVVSEIPSTGHSHTRRASSSHHTPQSAQDQHTAAAHWRDSAPDSYFKDSDQAMAQRTSPPVRASSASPGQRITTAAQGVRRPALFAAEPVRRLTRSQSLTNLHDHQIQPTFLRNRAHNRQKQGTQTEAVTTAPIAPTDTHITQNEMQQQREEQRARTRNKNLDHAIEAALNTPGTPLSVKLGYMTAGACLATTVCALVYYRSKIVDLFQTLKNRMPKKNAPSSTTLRT